MTVIYANSGDRDTLILQHIWEGINCRVIEIGVDTVDFEDEVDNALMQEENTLIICGHGTSHGLLHPNWNSGQYIIHENNVNLIHAQNVICSWCWASDFAETYNLHGFFTGMFISNVQEAEDNFIHIHDYEELDEEIYSYGLYFTNYINQCLHNNVPLSEWIGGLQEPWSYVAIFNQSRLRYYDVQQNA